MERLVVMYLFGALLFQVFGRMVQGPLRPELRAYVAAGLVSLAWFPIAFVAVWIHLCRLVDGDDS